MDLKRGEAHPVLKLLFDENDWTCFASTPKDTEVFPICDFDADNWQFFSINPLATEDRMPVEEWHSAKIPRRADINVTKFRNILIEMDKNPLHEQAAHMEQIGLPFSTCVFSGSKSYHWIISLETPCETRTEYDKLVKRVYKAVGITLVDITCKNPSRFSRFPDSTRMDTKQLQQTKIVRYRIPNQLLETWLVSRDVPPIEASEWETVPRRKYAPKDLSALFPSTRNFLRFGVEANWNDTLFKASADLCRNGWNIDEAITELSGITGMLDANDHKTIRSAYRSEESQK